MKRSSVVRRATPKRQTLAKQIAVRLTEGDVERLEELSKQLPIATRNAIARTALRLGLDVLESDPTRVLARPASKERSKSVRRRSA